MPDSLYHIPRMKWERNVISLFIIFSLILLKPEFLPAQIPVGKGGVAGGEISKANPVIPGFHPDPTICRAGKDYYIATSSNEYFPGVPIYQSRDLVHWKLIGHALNRPSQLNLDSVNCSGGIYAPTLRYHNGLFYLITTLSGNFKGRNRGNFLVTAGNPAGPWSEPMWLQDAPGIDPSLFFDDDGRVYYHGNMTPSAPVWDKHRNIWIREIDMKTLQWKGPRKEILDGSEYFGKGTLDGGFATGVNNYESPHIYKKNGWYYLMIAHGGTFQTHAVSVWRSRNIYGPYEMNPANPILTHRDLPVDFEITSAGHADLVQTPDGDWRMVFHARRPYGGECHILGRETFLAPVDWSGEWPVVNPDSEKGRASPEISIPGRRITPNLSMPARDEFLPSGLRPEWVFLRTPRTTWWSLSDRKSYLRIHLRPEKISEPVNPSFIGRCQEQPRCEAVVKMEFIPRSEFEEAGMVVERDLESYFKFTSGLSGNKMTLRLVKSGKAGSKEETLSETETKGHRLFLKTVASGVVYSFFFSYDGKEWINLKEGVDGSFLGASGMGRFTGTMIGLYASSNGEQSANSADFDWFEYKNLYVDNHEP